MSRLRRSLEKLREWQRRSKPLERGTSELKRTRIKPVNSKRRKKEHERTYGKKASWIRSLPSCVSGRGPTVCSHINPKNRGELPHGTGRKHDKKWTVPLTLEEERELHRGQDTFERTHNIDLTAEAERYHMAWLKRGEAA